MDNFPTFDFDTMQQIMQWLLVSGINCVADGVSTLAGYLPNPDPFPGILDGLTLGQDTPGQTAFYFINQFVDVATILGIFLAWIPMFATAWIIQMLWNWAKAKNKG